MRVMPVEDSSGTSVGKPFQTSHSAKPSGVAVSRTPRPTTDNPSGNITAPRAIPIDSVFVSVVCVVRPKNECSKTEKVKQAVVAQKMNYCMFNANKRSSAASSPDGIHGKAIFFDENATSRGSQPKNFARASNCVIEIGHNWQYRK
jgi:hypothetical protein